MLSDVFGQPNFVVRFEDTSHPLAGIHDVEIVRRANTFVLRFDRSNAYGGQISFANLIADRGASFLAAMAAAGPSVTRIIADMSDGGDDPNVVTFCSRHPDAILIADHDFLKSRGYSEFRALGALAPPWSERMETLVWRGSTTGHARPSDDDMSVGNARLIQRTRLCLALRGALGCDVKFSQIVQSDDPAHRQRLQAAGLLGEPIPAKTWRAYKFAFDVDGYSNAFSNLYTRLLLGCCVLKVDSEPHYRQWYYDDLKPWEHYVPVAADLSDLSEIIAWCRSHNAECGAIAMAGRALAMSRTFHTELARAAERLQMKFGAGHP